MKRALAIILVMILVVFTASCGKKETAKKLPKGATEDEANYPSREKDNFIENDNETGMTYKFGLKKYTDAFNSVYVKLGGEYDDYPYNKWKKKATEKQSNGKDYNYYYLDSGEIVLTATEEDESGELVNVGCGITVDKFNTIRNMKNKVMTVCGIMAVVSGGYSSDDVNFFGNLFVDTINYDEHCFWYEDSIYLYDKEIAQNGKATVLFRTMPAASNIEDDWNLHDYKEFWFENN